MVNLYAEKVWVVVHYSSEIDFFENLHFSLILIFIYLFYLLHTGINFSIDMHFNT